MENSWVLDDEHYLATIVHPKLKHFQMAAPGDKEKAIRLLKSSIQNEIACQMTTSSSVPYSINQYPMNNLSCRSHSKSLEGRGLLARLFDQVSDPVPLYLHECEEYFKLNHDNE